ncbi:cytochrome P450 2B2-like [Gigantopelta aegis]|uniref:cytochrome P450 2B2-like n=1 Tax=Gigantopelta aegis TaxID=1735272 RepID=UPI001B8874F7|nr:cytochrome P450 2B2-like [Gigantopelta aegis]
MDIIQEIITTIGLIPLPVLVFGAVVGYLLYCSITTPKNLPPGPFAWPVIGNMWDYSRLKGPLSDTFADLRLRYGSVFRIYYGKHLIVVVSGRSVFKEACSLKDVFRRRPSWQWATDRLHRSVVRKERWFNNATWFAMLKKSISYQEQITPTTGIEMKISNQAKLLTAKLKKKPGSGVPLGQLIDACMEDIICDVTVGSKSSFRSVLNTLFPKSCFQDSIPSIRVLPSDEENVHRRLTLDSESRDTVNTILTSHRASYKGDNIRDFTDLFIKVQLERRNIYMFDKATYLQSLSTLLLTAPNHVTCVLQWAFLLVTVHPKVQRKCQEEIDTIVGENEEIRFSNRPALPYVRATISEVKRYANIMTLSSPYTVTTDTTIGGHSIPREALVLFDLRPVLTDPVTCVHPERFQPERHVDSAGRVNEPDPRIDEFVGSQMVDHLSEMTSFLFFANILRDFSLTKLESDVLSLEYDRDAAPCPAPYNVIATQR